VTVVIDPDVASELAQLGAVAAAVAAISLITEDLPPGRAEFAGLRWVDADAKGRYLRALREDVDATAAWVDDFTLVLSQIERDCE
jgi:hypothetical protein